MIVLGRDLQLSVRGLRPVVSKAVRRDVLSKAALLLCPHPPCILEWKTPWFSMAGTLVCGGQACSLGTGTSARATLRGAGARIGHLQHGWQRGSTPLPDGLRAGQDQRARLRHTHATSAAATTEAPSGSSVAAALTAFDRVSILSEALPYLQRFRGKTIVVKYGGAAMKDPTLKAGVIKDLVLLACVGIQPVLVHGGGPEINSWLGKLGIESNFKNGLRVTDGPTMEVVEMVLGGRVNKGLVSLIQQAGGQAVGLCGKDSDIIKARQMVEKDIGFVGEVTSVDASLLRTLVQGGYIPVVASVASDSTGQALNVNADTAAGEIAAALKAEKLILMTDVPGVLRDKDDVATKFAELTIRNCKELVQEGIIGGGMIPKVDCCIRCLAQGVSATHIIDGRQQHSLLMEVLTDEGVGTMITG